MQLEQLGALTAAETRGGRRQAGVCQAEGDGGAGCAPASHQRPGRLQLSSNVHVASSGPQPGQLTSSGGLVPTFLLAAFLWHCPGQPSSRTQAHE